MQYRKSAIAVIAALAATLTVATPASAAWGGHGGWHGRGVGLGFATGAIVGSALAAPYYYGGYGYAPYAYDGGYDNAYAAAPSGYGYGPYAYDEGYGYGNPGVLSDHFFFSNATTTTPRPVDSPIRKATRAVMNWS